MATRREWVITTIFFCFAEAWLPQQLLCRRPERWNRLRKCNPGFFGLCPVFREYVLFVSIAYYIQTGNRCLIQHRRNYMQKELGIPLKDEVLPLSNTEGYFRPFLLNREWALKIGSLKGEEK